MIKDNFVFYTLNESHGFEQARILSFKSLKVLIKYIWCNNDTVFGSILEIPCEHQIRYHSFSALHDRLQLLFTRGYFNIKITLISKTCRSDQLCCNIIISKTVLHFADNEVFISSKKMSQSNRRRIRDVY